MSLPAHGLSMEEGQRKIDCVLVKKRGDPDEVPEAPAVPPEGL